jgi:hypothetical protein|tara:strand:- start:292 stop:453 length:162 start_codon:yes stop_codon:yes gene_type:complete
MIKQVGDRHGFEDWKMGQDCKYDGRQPAFWRGASEEEKDKMYQKYLNNQCFEE